MKIQIDTKEKTIKIAENANLGEICDTLDKLLPGEWKSYTLQTDVIINWYNPIPWTTREPWRVGDVTYQPYTTCYNIEVSN